MPRLRANALFMLAGALFRSCEIVALFVSTSRLFGVVYSYPLIATQYCRMAFDIVCQSHWLRYCVALVVFLFTGTVLFDVGGRVGIFMENKRVKSISSVFGRGEIRLTYCYCFLSLRLICANLFIYLFSFFWFALIIYLYIFFCVRVYVSYFVDFFSLTERSLLNNS